MVEALQGTLPTKNRKFQGLPWWLSGKESTCQCRTLVQSLIWEDPTCWGAAKLVHHNYRACALEPMSHNY